MPPEIKSLLFDMKHAAMGIEMFTRDKTLDDFNSDLMLRMAVERQFEIIGEAMNRLRKVDRNLIECISEYRSIISFRNVLIHGYDEVNTEITWRIVQEKLPILHTQLDELLK